MSIDSYGMPDQVGYAFGMSLKAAKIIRLLLAILLAFLLTLLVVTSHSLNIFSVIILSAVWILVILIAASGRVAKGQGLP